MSTLLRNMLYPFMAPADDDTGNDGGGAGADRGDDFVPTDDEVDAAKAGSDSKTDPAKSEEGEEEETEAGLRKAAPADTGDEKGEEKPAGKDRNIPLSRHKEMLDKLRAREADLERKLALYEKGDRTAATNDTIAGLETKVAEQEKIYTKLLTDGEPEKAAETMAQIRKLEREISDVRTDVQVQAAEVRAVEKARFDIVVERLETAYPVLNPEHESYDADIVKEVLELQRGFALQNFTQAQALQKAVKYVIRPETKTQEQATSVTPRVDKDAIADERKAAATKKALEATGRQPPALKVGMDSDRAGGNLSAKDVIKMSQEQFAKLTEEQLAKLRGDTV